MLARDDGLEAVRRAAEARGLQIESAGRYFNLLDQRGDEIWSGVSLDMIYGWLKARPYGEADRMPPGVTRRSLQDSAIFAATG